MGWSSGSEIYDKIIVAAMDAIPDIDTRVKFHKRVIRAFEDHDWDCQEDCVAQDPAFDTALYDLHHEWFSEDLDDPL